MNLYTSDLHFGHQKIIAFDNRPFAGCMVNNFTPASFEELVENNKAFRGE